MTRALVSTPENFAPALDVATLDPPRPADLRVRVTAASVDPVDTLYADGLARTIFGLTDTAGLGWSLTGVVTGVGADVTGFSVGDQVAALHREIDAPVRAHAEETLVPAEGVAHLPPGLDPVAAASLPLNGLVASQLVERLGPADGRSVLVTGAAGSIGGYAVALARRAGWTVTGLARETDREFVLRAGAVELVTEVPGPSFDAVVDGAVMHADALPAIRDGGMFVGVTSSTPATPERGIDVAIENVEPDGARLAGLLALAASGDLELRVAGRVRLTEAAVAYDKVAGGGQRGRWILVC